MNTRLGALTLKLTYSVGAAILTLSPKNSEWTINNEAREQPSYVATVCDNIGARFMLFKIPV